MATNSYVRAAIDAIDELDTEVDRLEKDLEEANDKIKELEEELDELRNRES